MIDIFKSQWMCVRMIREDFTEEVGFSLGLLNWVESVQVVKEGGIPKRLNYANKFLKEGQS